MIDRVAAETAIRGIFGGYRALQPADAATINALADGKLYELFVLAHVVDRLVTRGFSLTFRPSRRYASAIRFKGAPGLIDQNDAHFEVQVPQVNAAPLLRLYVDIEFSGLSQRGVTAPHRNDVHEVDIVLTSVDRGRPRFDEILFAVECKAVANFTKAIIKETLGVRRELSLLASPRPSLLSHLIARPAAQIPAEPPSEYCLIFIDPNGLRYQSGPSAFGVELGNLYP